MKEAGDLYTVRAEDLICAIHQGYVMGRIESACGVEPSLLSDNGEANERTDAWIGLYSEMLLKARKRKDGSIKIPLVSVSMSSKLDFPTTDYLDREDEAQESDSAP